VGPGGRRHLDRDTDAGLGRSSTDRRTTGALYDPARDRWSPIARGTPAAKRWSTLPAGPLARGARAGAATVWTGREAVIWSGWSTAAASSPYRDGAAYRPATST
jgi:hypothetical protein